MTLTTIIAAWSIWALQARGIVEQPISSVQIDSCMSQLSDAISVRQEGNIEGAVLKFNELIEICPDNFLVTFEYGRTLTMKKEFIEAAIQLDSAIEIASSNGHDVNWSVFNVRGFVAIMLEEYESALEFFMEGLIEERYNTLDDSTKMKINNNAGIVHLALDQYERAAEHFRAAEELGSELAKGNLDKIDSIIQALEANDESIPGPFAAVVGSARREQLLPIEMARVARSIGIPKSELSVYSTTHNRFAIVQVHQVSYLLARRIAEDARTKGIEDAYIASIANWSLHTQSQDLLSNRD